MIIVKRIHVAVTLHNLPLLIFLRVLRVLCGELPFLKKHIIAAIDPWALKIGSLSSRVKDNTILLKSKNLKKNYKTY